MLTAIYQNNGCKFVHMVHLLKVSRDSLTSTLAALTDAGWVMRNPGYGHPMRPEYILTPKGEAIAPVCQKLDELLAQPVFAGVAALKWTLPVLHLTQLGHARFNSIRGELPGITARALASCLRALEDAGLVRRDVIASHPPTVEYKPTAQASQAWRRVSDLIS